MWGFLFWALVALVMFWVVAPAVLVAVGLPFRECIGGRTFDDGRVIDQYELPDWLRWLQNPEDHLTGDSRGWFWFEYMPAWVPDVVKMWYWSGVRNTWNYLKRRIIGINIKAYTIRKWAGQDYVADDLANQGFQILLAWPNNRRTSDRTWFPRPMLYWVREVHGGRGICFQLGWKIKLTHNAVEYDDPIDYWKGFTFELNPYKRLDEPEPRPVLVRHNCKVEGPMMVEAGKMCNWCDVTEPKP